MNTLRLFIALDLPETIKTQIEQQQTHLKTSLPANLVRWTSPQHWHLTLVFLGNTPDHALNTISQTLNFATRYIAPFQLGLGAVGAFPSLHRPSVLWLGLTGELASLTTLQTRISQQLNTKQEAENFKPHITLGRTKTFGNHQHIQESLLSLETSETTPWTVTEVQLYHSSLKKSGATYQKLQSHPLKTP